MGSGGTEHIDHDNSGSTDTCACSNGNSSTVPNTNTNNNLIPSLNTQQGEKNNLLRLSPRKPRNMKNLSLDLSAPALKQQHEEAIKTILSERPPTLFRARTGSSSLPFRHPSLSIHNNSTDTFDSPPPPTLQRRRTTLAITIPSRTTTTINNETVPSRSDPLTASPISFSPIIPATPDDVPSTFASINKDPQQQQRQQQQQSLTHSMQNLNLMDDDLSAGSFRKGAYKDGPRCVIDPNLYLYSEPTLDQIKQFDIVINVAKELKDYTEIIEKDKLIDTNYIFVPWTHTSHISRDFAHLVPIIENGLAQNKKIMVHCQCGVSRSASLIVAFIMKHRNLNLNDAYNDLKARAPLISPNMTLIFQLMEWGNALTGNQTNSNVSTPASAVGSSNSLNLFVPPNMELLPSPTKLSEVIH